METKKSEVLTVESTIRASMDKVWRLWTEPEHIKNWYFASDDWHAPAVENDLQTDGKFKIVMAAKDGSFGFDFEGTYTAVNHHRNIEYILADDRKVSIQFEDLGGTVKLTESFDAEQTNSLELQQNGWQAIVDNFKNYVENLN